MSKGFRKLFPVLNALVTTHQSPGLGTLVDLVATHQSPRPRTLIDLVATHQFPGPETLVDLGGSDFEQRDAEVAYRIIQKSLESLCDECKTRDCVYQTWRFYGGNYIQERIRTCSECGIVAKVKSTWKTDYNVYRYTCSDSSPGVVKVRRVICLFLDRHVAEFSMYKLPAMDTLSYTTLSSMERTNTSFAFQWIERCRRLHYDTCGKNVDNALPGMKVIDCISGKICTRASGQPYVALSYVWGPPPKASRPIVNKISKSFPRTIQDAMLVAKELEVPYLWVDRYCIDQNNKNEKHIMVSNMDKIYSGAELTIIALGSDPDYGLPGVSRPRRHQISMQTSTHNSIIRYPSAIDETENSSWVTRAWTYQEMLLSRRRLVFTDSQMILQCCEYVFHEALSIPLPYPMPGGARPPTPCESRPCHTPTTLPASSDAIIFPANGIGMFWFDILDRIQDYTDRTLSYPEDVQNGFEGVFNAFSRKIPGCRNHFWGIPTPDSRPLEYLLRHLTWYVPKPADRRPGCWPSWSWISIMGKRVEFRPREEVFYDPLGVLDCTLTQKNGAKEDISSYVKAQRECVDYHPWIDLTTVVIECCTLKKTKEYSMLDWALVHPSLDHKSIGVHFDVDMLDEQLSRRTTAIYVGGTDHTFLFIIAQDTEAGLLHRVGLGKSYKGDWVDSSHLGSGDPWKGWQRKEVRLV
jgi:hypothetical protein